MGVLDQRLARDLKNIVVAEREFHDGVASFLNESGDDDEVDALLEGCLESLRTQSVRLDEYLRDLSDEGARPRGVSRDIVSRPVTHTSIPEERIAEGLVTAFAFLNGSRAAYRSLAFLASEAGSAKLEQNARETEAERNRLAGEVWRLIPSRTKIAFNVLTAGETDPSVETRTSQNSLV